MIDEFMPNSDFSERHQVIVRAPLERVYRVALELDLSQATFTRLLFRLRGIPASQRFTLTDFLNMRFILLAEQPNEELLLGLVGRFWTLTGGLLRMDAAGFRRFTQAGYAKAVWNFTVNAQAGSNTLLTTESRILCLDDASRWKFRGYWTLVGPFSAFIRREMLQTIKQRAESASL